MTKVKEAYVALDSTKDSPWVYCPYCGKKQFPVTRGAVIQGQKFKCKRCKENYVVNIGKFVI